METSAGATAAAATPAVASGVAQHDNANTRMPAVDVDAQAAAQEHVRKSTPFSSLDVVKAEFGRGMFIYFHYVRFVGIANAALALFAALSWLVANADGLLGENRGEESSIHSVLLSAYPKASAPTWYVCTCAMVVIGFAIGPVYRKCVCQCSPWACAVALRLFVLVAACCGSRHALTTAIVPRVVLGLWSVGIKESTPQTGKASTWKSLHETTRSGCLTSTVL